MGQAKTKRETQRAQQDGQSAAGPFLYVCLRPSCHTSRGIHHYYPEGGRCLNCGSGKAMKRMTAAEVQELDGPIQREQK